jgi:hypothetical protein
MMDWEETLQGTMELFDAMFDLDAWTASGARAEINARLYNDLHPLPQHLL